MWNLEKIKDFLKYYSKKPLNRISLFIIFRVKSYDGCNCRNKDECPLDGNCQTKSIVYKAEITTTDVGETKEYIGMTAGTFKARYANHKKSINSPRYSNETELSKYAWKLKQNNRPYTIKWSVLSHASPYTTGANSCNLGLEEKFYLMKSHKDRTLNKRTELFSKCRHRNSFSARNFKRTRA